MRCPVCKAENVAGPQCRRCKADLGLLVALEGLRRQELGAARHCLAEGRWPEALTHAAQAYWLQSDEESRRLLAVTCLLNRDFASAWYYYRAGTEGKRASGPPA
jgi:hypothetical protein